MKSLQGVQNTSKPEPKLAWQSHMRAVYLPPRDTHAAYWQLLPEHLGRTKVRLINTTSGWRNQGRVTLLEVTDTHILNEQTLANNRKKWNWNQVQLIRKPMTQSMPHPLGLHLKHRHGGPHLISPCEIRRWLKAAPSYYPGKVFEAQEHHN